MRDQCEPPGVLNFYESALQLPIGDDIHCFWRGGVPSLSNVSGAQHTVRFRKRGSSQDLICKATLRYKKGGPRFFGLRGDRCFARYDESTLLFSAIRQHLS
jgi:hypothetical protein